MQELGLNMTAKDLRERAKKSNPYMVLSTGDIYGHQKNTNIYRYKNGITDFSQKFHTPENCEIITLDNFCCFFCSC